MSDRREFLKQSAKVAAAIAAANAWKVTGGASDAARRNDCRAERAPDG